MDRGRGPIVTVLVQNGTLHGQDTIVAGTTSARPRDDDDNGQRVTEAAPSMPVEIIGFSDVPAAGDTSMPSTQRINVRTGRGATQAR